jgi:uncharacterized cupredoxin-like copper-binding protein
MKTRNIAAPLALAALLAGTAACGGTAEAGGPLHAPGTSNAANKLTITTHGMAYTIKGSPRPGHIDITFDNADGSAHEAQIVRLKDGKTIQDVLADMKKGGEQAAAADIAGDPDQAYGTPALLYGGQKTEVVSDTIQPGTYGVVCFLPGPDGMPHIAMGMAAQFTVRGKESGRTPKSDGTVELGDHGITVPDGFGSGTYTVTNTGTTPHSFSIARLDGSLDQLFGYIGGQFAQNKPIDGGPGSLVAGVATLNPGQTAYLVIDLKPGHYGYVSTVQGSGDPSDTDYARGLHGEFTIG